MNQGTGIPPAEPNRGSLFTFRFHGSGKAVTIRVGPWKVVA